MEIYTFLQMQFYLGRRKSVLSLSLYYYTGRHLLSNRNFTSNSIWHSEDNKGTFVNNLTLSFAVISVMYISFLLLINNQVLYNP